MSRKNQEDLTRFSRVGTEANSLATGLLVAGVLLSAGGIALATAETTSVLLNPVEQTTQEVRGHILDYGVMTFAGEMAIVGALAQARRRDESAPQ